MARRTARSVSESIVRLSGRPVLLGTITATTTKNNHTTAVPFNNTGNALLGKTLLIQPDSACYIGCGLTNAGTVTTANGVKLAADERVILTMDDIDSSVAAGEFYGWFASVAVSGTTVLKVWELL